MNDYASVILERADGLKYELYERLAQPYVHDVTVMDLAVSTGKKYQVIYNLIQEILEDLIRVTDKPRAWLRKRLLAAKELPLSLDQYRAYLAKQGRVMQLVDFILRAPTPTVTQFCADQFTSRSTLSRMVRVLNQLADEYSVHVRLAKMTLEGSEYNVRYFLFSLYWWAYRGAWWPFAPITQARLHAECDRIGIFNERPLTQLQMQYFLAISHLRLGKGNTLPQNAALDAFDTRVSAFNLRQGKLIPPFTRADMTYYNFFQISLPRFDQLARKPQNPMIEIALLTDHTTAAVVDALSAVLYLPAAGDIDVDMHLNLLRLCFGYQIHGGDFPQAHDYIEGGCCTPDLSLVTRLTAVLAALPDQPAFAGFHKDARKLAVQVAGLAQTYRQAGADAALRVHLAIDPMIAGYRELNGFINCQPAVARVAEADADVTIAGPDECATPTQMSWFADALEINLYREHLITYLTTGELAVGDE